MSDCRLLAARLLVIIGIRDNRRTTQPIVDLATSDGWCPWEDWPKGYRDWITGQRAPLFAWRMRRRAHRLYPELEEA